ncbi:MAG: L-serine ammonia-lyase [Gammaproteobacteria bacterium RIFCSPLOWO2_02_FULL_42_14]|nr:MAG: L-serine ammonia-lyase [Gammaproteobacteria bacterium RIFCSPHIGHO2_02_FULL_42_43]OGT28892.1 MAG: L-serine ammonia-lyase [Gammaproteobacteria bacterium RIFCSPHIGHO2_01_FULL_42_8]OGT51961.1 MAG: L-serine ammonia-lyase [Gammaproteobacteria bacterium RIFCSPHIGHO2_12_FULL_41_25]OGT61066.1 MAG: L-serine ammonia-lyase [Gammaproteobacteria bacterium RIFCSPLOWO2_02_FULL_42_14]OGT86993.1 MAG: L-serine ammonia-lyase [Gammaproteobacteria bacterium RIFCSPLOWO2_12_FULL_42_18]
MEISVFDLFSIGIGPSSSHTVGPMRAALTFLQAHNDSEFQAIERIHIRLHGSLAFTGIGHGTNKAILMGLIGETPEDINPFLVDEQFQKIVDEKKINLLGKKIITFDNASDLVFDYENMLPHHPNGMTFITNNKNKTVIRDEKYYSVGGGFIVSESQLKNPSELISKKLPFSFNIAAELLSHCKQEHCSIAELMMKNEKVWNDEKNIIDKLNRIATVMEECIQLGCTATETILPGGLKVRRRAPSLYQQLKKDEKTAHPDIRLMEWLDLFAIAVNEENAAGHRVVTAPTNGAAGIIPAVLEYMKRSHTRDSKKIAEFLLTAGAIGILYKKNASISGAEMGCQGEVGVACSMAAAGLTAALGGTIYQVENAAEIGMEHNLGLTCDPVKGLVQIPCIERNAMGAVKAVNATRLALAGDGKHKVSLDMVINTMREIGNSMSTKYKETSQGGLAVNVIEC